MPVPVVQTPSGTRLVAEPAPQAPGRVVVYCRVSSGDRKGDLERQVARTVQGATGQGLTVADVVTEIDRDRLARFGVEHLEGALSAAGRRLIVLDSAETADDLVGDITAVLTSMCARLYGRRCAKDRVARAVAVATGEEAAG